MGHLIEGTLKPSDMMNLCYRDVLKGGGHSIGSHYAERTAEVFFYQSWHQKKKRLCSMPNQIPNDRVYNVQLSSEIGLLLKVMKSTVNRMRTCLDSNGQQSSDCLDSNGQQSSDWPLLREWRGREGGMQVIK